MTFIALASTAGSGMVFAQTLPPSAGQLLQQLAPSPPPAPPSQNNGVTPPPTPSQAPQAASTATILLKSISFSGNTHIDDATLRSALPQIAQLQGQKVTSAQINTLAEAVTQYYRQRGYFISLAYVPRQTVNAGVVTIAILEGQLGETRIGNNGGYTAERLQRYENEALCGEASAGCAGEVLTRAQADRAVGLVSLLPGVASASGTLAPGAKVGTSDYTLDAVAGPAVTGSVGLDNYGNVYTGRVRETGDVRWNNPLGIGDLLTGAVAASGQGLRGTDDNGALNAVIDYSLPLGYDGWRIGANYSRLSYRLGEPFDAIDAYGSGNAYSAYVSYPLVITPYSNLSARASYGTTWLKDSLFGETSRPTDNAATFGLYGNEIDTLGGGGAMQYGLALTRGRISYGSGPLPGGIPNAGGYYNKVNLNADRDQTLVYLANGTHRVSLYGAVRGQWSDTNLHPVDEMSLGGPGGVRGYPIGEASGDEGAIATMELRDSFAISALGGLNLTVSLFRDNGWLTVNKDPWPGYQGPKNRNLGSTGIGVDLLSQGRYDIKAMWALRDAGGEVDTSTKDSRSWLWLQTQVFF
ncbi:ShlB/FhaC/HecB family hemolysin secretion/activation protein [Pseudomonas sp. TH03]|uniref:ShlB/FhaC/HecB family hemolysin secretion/activation protein n=1 Tax=Pseudomonas sp. TH03 TaxID=2796369 RepID=UPI001911726F|nr:ShlB/FhaC/HecB family hemolysin secretion/activation protein [Pseudomonas sp. TH03]MBK5550148.1 ShlB/FhaC/HecB family hemolysin secretion/activation protein [Pseudomonas sp. TH03]